MSARHTLATTGLGVLLLVAERSSHGDDALTGLYFSDHTYPPDPASIGERVDETEDRLLAQAAREVREYLAGARRGFTVPVATSGDDFSERVWSLLRRIPFGETTTYGALAAELGSPGVAQRVGQAVGHNPLCVVIPCHRVLGSNGSLTGYAGGLNRKRALLQLEEPEAASAGRLF